MLLSGENRTVSVLTTQRSFARATRMAFACCWYVAIVCGVFPQAPASGGEPAVETVTAEVVETRRQQAEQAADLDEATRQKVLQTYDQAAGMLDSAAKSAARVAELQAMIDTANAQTADFIQQLAGLGTTSLETPTGQEDLQEIKRIRAEKDDALSKAKETLAALEAETARRVSSRKEIPGLIAISREQLASYDATAELLPLQQRVATARVTLLEQEAGTWREVENRLMEQEAKRQADQARQEAIEAGPALRPLARVN